MNYTKPMIELVYEIRRLVPSEMKPGVKLANPDLFDELIEFYHTNAQTVAKALIKELLSLAGESWADALTTYGQRAHKPQHTKMYRGITSLEETPRQSENKKKPSNKTRIYRGRVIAD